MSPLRTLAAASFSPPRPQLLASPAPRRRERSGGGGKGLRTRGARSLDDAARASTSPFPLQVKTEGRGRQATGPGEKRAGGEKEEEGGGGGDPGSAEPPVEGPRPAASDAETRAGAGRAPGGRGVRRRGRRALARGPRPREGGRRGRFPGLQRLAGLQAATHPSRPRDSPGAFSPRLDPAPPRALRRFPGRAFWELGPPARARSASRGVYLLTPGAHTHARSLAARGLASLQECAPANRAPSQPELSLPPSETQCELPGHRALRE